MIILGTVATISLAAYHPVNEDIVKEIREKTDLWEPAEVDQNPLSQYAVEHLNGLLGTNLKAPTGLYKRPDMSANGVPDAFDSRTQWKTCIHPIRDQQKCGSCWAFGATEALSDRICITSSGKTDVVLSPEDLVSCDSSDMGCNGGWLNNAWDYLQNSGAVADKCFPY